MSSLLPVEANPVFSPADEHWMRHAMMLAARGEAHGEVPVGAVVVLDGEVIGEGWNQPISANDPTAHAEILAVRQAAKRVNNYRLVGASLYVTLEPCTMCVGALVHARIARVIFATREPKAGAVVSHAQLLTADYFNHQVVYEEGLLAVECKHQLSHFFAARRRQKREARQLNGNSESDVK